DRAVGIAVGWGFPGMAGFLGRRSDARALAICERIDRFFARWPDAADYVVTVWRPRRTPATAPGEALRVRAVDPAYRWKVGAEKDFGKAFFNPAFHRAYAAAERIANEALTGDATRSWLDDLAARGPFRTAAALGCDQGCPEGAWAARHASDRIDVYELSSDVIRRARAELPRGADVRYVEADLNFARLPPAAYDAVWSSGCLHHLVNLERLMEEVARALRPGGLFAVHDYVGERRFRLSDARLARVNAFLRDVPARFRHGGIDAVAWQPMLSPFCGVRSDEVLSVAAERFDVVHRATAGVLFPLFLYLDV